MADPRGKDWVAIILAIGIATAINIIVAAVLIDALLSDNSGLSENATQILTGAFGGMLGVLGSYIGFQAGKDNAFLIDQHGTDDVEPTQEAPGPDIQHPPRNGAP